MIGESKYRMLLGLVITSYLLLIGEVIGGILDPMAKKVNAEQELNKKFYHSGFDTVGGTSAADLHATFTGTKPEVQVLSKDYKSKLMLFLEDVQHMNTLGEVLDEQERQLAGEPCGLDIVCDADTPFRTADGTCNNLQNPEFGSAFLGYRRFVPSDYEDGVFLPRVTERSTGEPLPSPRQVSVLLHTPDPNATTFSDTNTHMLMQFAQFLDHDITLSPFQRGEDGSTITCCQEDLSPQARAEGLNVDDRPQCFGIDVPGGDRQFSNRQCLNFIRSDQVFRPDCRMLPVEQLNALTAYVDGSQIYGSTEEEQLELREFSSGLLKAARLETELLPPSEIPDCITPDPPNFCFRAGDERVNEQMSLTSMHTIWLREHNRIARTLLRLNPRWSDERIFQETRRIVGAMLQKIVFAEFLPIILSQQTLARNLLLPTKYDEFGSIYDPTVDATIHNAFSTAAYRFGHSLVKSVFNLRQPNFKRVGGVLLRRSFGNTALILNTGGRLIDEFTRGLISDKARVIDRHITKELTDFLFEDANGNSLDLMALNIQRGRDHGLPGYNAFRTFCGLPIANTFQDLVHHTEEVQQIFSQLYTSPGEIDLFSAGISETPLPGGLLGPTFACLVAIQFRNLKIGDRFFYETGDPTTRFTLDQLMSIRNVSLARVVCDNTDTIATTPQVFFRPGFQDGNKIAKCFDSNAIPRLDLELWRDPTARK